MAYFAQFALDVPAVAMVTASHNDNGWTGVKMGAQRPAHLRARGDEALKEIVLGGTSETRAGGSLRPCRWLGASAIIADLTSDRPIVRRKLKVVAACGNGTAGAFAPRLLEQPRLRGDRRSTASSTTPSRTTIPIPKTCKMLHAMADKVREHRRRCRPGLRRRRRPLRRGRQRGRGDLRRQDRRDAGARSVEPPSGARPSSST